MSNWSLNGKICTGTTVTSASYAAIDDREEPDWSTYAASDLLFPEVPRDGTAM